MIILKLGGSVVTDKSRPFSFREEVVRRLAEEIRDSDVEGLLIVHGGGAFGHPVASEYGIEDGLNEPGQLMGVAKTRAAMAELNQRIVEVLVECGIPAVSIQTSAVFECRDKRIYSGRIEPVRDFLGIGAVPVLYGDVVVDRSLGVCILSGDQIVAYLAERLKPEQVILATDVDGVLDKNGRVIERVNDANAPSAIEASFVPEGDVTGGMKGKIEELLELAKRGVSSVIVNALVEDRLKNALLGKKTIGTLFEVKR